MYAYQASANGYAYSSIDLWEPEFASRVVAAGLVYEEAVSEALADGWQLHGGIVEIDALRQTHHYRQYLIRAAHLEAQEAGE